MEKDILVYSDGTGQIGGMRPDQRLSNVYKIYRATRPGPASPISRYEQVAIYDPGLGAGETGGLSLQRIRNFFAAALGTGIDENVIDCYAAIIAHYKPGDRIHLIGFSRGAYTVRVVANVLNVCGIPTQDSKGNEVPTYGPALRKIASDGVRYVYNHGAGHPRAKYEDEREAKAERFRRKYGSEGTGVDGESQGNVQPTFVGVFDTVAALGSRTATVVSVVIFLASLALAFLVETPFAATVFFGILPIAMLFWALKSIATQFKYYFEDETRRLRWWNPRDWWDIRHNWHMGWWSGKNFDQYIDKEIPFLRHAISIDELRAKFPRVPWGRTQDVQWNIENGNDTWMKQVWFSGNHSDIGGSYPEDESRLSDIALHWMVRELIECVPTVQVRMDLLVTTPDPSALQHDEIQNVLDMQPSWLRTLTAGKLTWTKKARKVHNDVELHESVIDRFKMASVPQMDQVKPYRPKNLSSHNEVRSYF